MTSAAQTGHDEDDEADERGLLDRDEPRPHEREGEIRCGLTCVSRPHERGGPRGSRLQEGAARQVPLLTMQRSTLQTLTNQWRDQPGSARRLGRRRAAS